MDELAFAQKLQCLDVNNAGSPSALSIFGLEFIGSRIHASKSVKRQCLASELKEWQIVTGSSQRSRAPVRPCFCQLSHVPRVLEATRGL